MIPVPEAGGADDEKWRPIADAARKAAGLLGWGIPDCLPGEREACGGSCYSHAWSTLVTVTALADHHLIHMGGIQESARNEIYDHVMAEIIGACENPP